MSGNKDGRWRGRVIQGGHAAAIGLKQIDGSGNCSYVLENPAAKRQPNRVALLMAQEQRATLLMDHILRWIDPDAHVAHTVATDGVPRLTPHAPIVALWCTRAWVRAAHEDTLAAPILAIWGDVQGTSPVVGGEFCMTRTGYNVPAPRTDRLQAVLWDGQEEHATCSFKTGARRRHSMAIMLTQKTTKYHQGKKAAQRPKPIRQIQKRQMMKKLRAKRPQRPKRGGS
jgi:hypothetical protein